MWVNYDDPINGIDDDFNGYIDDLHGWDFYNWDNDPMPFINIYDYYNNDNDHGTHVAGIIGATGNNKY